MNIYIIRNGEQIGPFTWGEVFVMLERNELSLDDLGRSGPDGVILSLREFGFWLEGDEVGPFTWNDIAVMLREGVLDTDVQARFDDNHPLSTLADLIRQSEEVESVPPDDTGTASVNPFSRATSRIQDLLSFSHAKWILAGAAIALVSGIIAILVVPERPHPVSEPSTALLPVAEPKAEADTPSRPTEPSPAIAAQIASPIPEAKQEEPPPAEVPVISRQTSPESPSTISPPPPAPERPHPVEPDQKPPSPSIARNSTPAAKPTLAANPTPTPSSAPPQQAKATYVSDFFKIESIKILRKPPKDGIGVWFTPQVNGKPGESVFRPALEIRVSAKENIRSDKTFARAYFFGANDRLIHSLKVPSNSGKPGKSGFAAPVLFHKNQPASLFFEIPEHLEKSTWKAVVVFGDKYEAQAITYPTTSSAFLLDYPEKDLVSGKTAMRIVRKPALDPLIEHVVKTRNPRMPQITLFLRPPRNISDSSEIRGVMALCLLAGNLDQIRRELQKEEMSGDHHGLLAFADKNKLAILAWGSSSALWARANYDQLTRQQAREYEASFAIVANAWERGVLELGEKYGMPTKNFLIQGQCGSAHLAKALCLAKPQYFLAIHIHIPGYFERPTPEASRVLWCITTGELYATYDYSLRFLKDAQALGYPILYKAFIGLGHSGHPDATAMGLEFFKFALTQQTLIEERERKKASAIDSFALSASPQNEPWLESFRNPPMYGDIINQEVFPADQVELIPAGFRTAIPTKELATIWQRNR